MAKLFNNPDDPTKETIDKDSVARFFKARAQKVNQVGSIRAVIYQDKNPELAYQRNKIEKETLLPILKLSGQERVLDVGCGTGRWSSDIATNCMHYHGIDFSPELIEHAKKNNAELKNAYFSVAPAEDYTLSELKETEAFDRIVCLGVLIYLNDIDMERAFHCMGEAAGKTAKIVLREPVGINLRLTIKEHFSDEMNQVYNAIYRTQQEIEGKINDILGKYGFTLTESGDMYPDHLNNRNETVQKWFLLERL